MLHVKKSDVCIRATSGTEAELERVAALYRDFNVLHAEMGMSIRLVEGGERLWVDSMRRLLGRYSQIIIGEHEDRIVGFSAGVLRVLPPYYGSIVIGYWDSVYIEKEYRRIGLGDAMMSLLLDWWRQKGAVLAEGDRLSVNENVKGNYVRSGFHEEIVKYRRFL